MNIEKELVSYLNKGIESANDYEIYLALMQLSKNLSKTKQRINKGKKLYYISAEFLIGKLLSNNLINLGIYQEVKDVLNKYNHHLETIEELENEPSLGNGGLGRLAACFLDSIASLGLNGDGIGLNYHFGLFKQTFKDNKQVETKNDWITKDSWLNDTQKTYTVDFNNFSLKAKLYDIDVVGYHNQTNKLHLFDLVSLDETLVKENINFDQKDILHNLTLFLYPDDSKREGQILRIYQQYFMVSTAAQLILDEQKQLGNDLSKLNENIVIQINDTHPTLVIPELIRLLIKEGIDKNKAIEIVAQTVAYTNHTILSEALEKWPLDYLNEVVPHLVPIIEDLNKIVNDKFQNPALAIIDQYNMVHMARIDMHYSFSINGVAKLHTDILKNEELKDFYQIYQHKFNNKTNGITFRRWLMHCNSKLASLITDLIGNQWQSDASYLENLLQYKDDVNVLRQLEETKYANKLNLCHYLKKHENIEVNPDSVFLIQIKRLHEYKRQQMNALYVIHKYLEIRSGKLPKRPITVIFGAKAAPAYYMAKNIIHLLLCLADLINNDPLVSKHLKVIMVKNYNVTYAEKLIPACDISEQISLASKEASGTGNMKFMLNGAVTIGTLDGANIEISELVGQENIFIFGKDSKTVINHYNNQDYNARTYYEKDNIKPLIDFITDEQLTKFGDYNALNDLKNELINKDWFMTLLDIEDYIQTKDKALKAYEDRMNWNKMALVNIAKAGYFSSDRTIFEYNRDIWKLN